MAQGFLPESDKFDETTVTVEGTSNKFFDELLSNSLFLEVKRERFENINSYKVHDIVYDFALSVSKGEALIWGTGCSIDENCKSEFHLLKKIMQDHALHHASCKN
ncbi:hypothetical protein SLE2022_398440 [Rubroshorea leprosula]